VILGGKENNKHVSKELNVGGSSSRKAIVLGMRSRTGQVKAATIPNNGKIIIASQLENHPVCPSGRHFVSRLCLRYVSRRQEWSQSPLTLALRGSNSNFTAIDSIKSETVAQTKGTGQRAVLKLFHYSWRETIPASF
jgi:hypothetical protein